MDDPLLEPILSVRDLTVRYPGLDSAAVDGVSLDLGQEKVAIVGPNGSGKSSLLKAALGLAPISRGSVRVLGQDARTVQGETRVGTNLEEVYRLMTLPVDRLISVWADLKGGSEEEIRRWVSEFGLTTVLNRPLFRLSTGQMKLIGNLLALAFSPRLLLLDEPFDNVDFGRRRKCIDLLTQSPAATVLNTHELDLLASFPDWGLYFMFEGQLVGRFRAGDIDRLFVNRGQPAKALATFQTSIGPVSVTMDRGEVPMKGISNLSYLLDRVA
ncbi:MAG: ATP-binding cassette domain-containing protein [Thermoplasmata archaeon]